MTFTAFSRSQMLWSIIGVLVCGDLAHAEGRPSLRHRSRDDLPSMSHRHRAEGKAAPAAPASGNISALEARGEERLKVRARASLVDNGALGNRRILDLPYSVTVINEANLRNRQVKSLGRVFENDGSVVRLGDTYSMNAYSLNVRGIPLDDYNGYKINGTPFFMTTVELPVESFESIQLLKGASGFMYGFNAPGGIANFVMKKPTERRTLSVDIGYSANAVMLQHLDVGGRFLKNNIVGYRLNLTHEAGPTYNGSHLKRYSGSFSTDVRLTHDLTWTADALYQSRVIDQGIQNFYIADPPSFGKGPLPPAISGHKNLTVNPGTFFTSHTIFLGTGLKWHIRDSWNLRADYSHSRDYRRYKGEWMTLQDRSGGYDALLRTNPGSWAAYNQAQMILTWQVATGLWRHHVTAGIAWQGLEKFLPYDFKTINLGMQNLYRAIRPQSWQGSFNTATYRTYHSDQTGFFLSDTLDFNPQWSLLAGLRYTIFSQKSWDAQQIPSSERAHPVTPTVALLYHPWQNTTFYVSYVQALESGGTVATNYVNAFANLPPIRSDQVEFGAKIDRKRWSMTAALYQITRGAQYANAQNIFVSDGSTTYRGAEWAGRWRLPAGFVLSNSIGMEYGRYTKADPDIIGNAIEGVPTVQNMFTLHKGFAHLPGFSVEAEVHHTASMWGDSRNLYKVPHYTLLNLRARYDMDVARHHVSLQAEMDNVQNLQYWGFLQTNYLFVGMPRTIFLNARFSL